MITEVLDQWGRKTGRAGTNPQRWHSPSAITCGNHPNISSDGSSSTETFEFIFLKDTEESDLCLKSALK